MKGVEQIMVKAGRGLVRLNNGGERSCRAPNQGFHRCHPSRIFNLTLGLYIHVIETSQ